MKRKSNCVKGAFYTAFGIGVLAASLVSPKFLIVLLAISLVLMGSALIAKRT